MNRYQLEHIIRATGAIVDSRTIVVIGSQAILGSVPNPPAELAVSMEADVWPEDAPEKSDLIDGAIGELSPFHETYGYYAHGVGPETAELPSGWRQRAVAVCNENTLGITGLCLHPVDIAVSKLLAGRPKDLDFVRTCIKNGLVTRGNVLAVLDELPAAGKETARARLDRLA